MGDFSRDPKQRLIDSVEKQYVGVRLQQGVPVLDADWNESEDLRRWELWSLAKWFVGSGVPENNQGFKVIPVINGGINTVILVANKANPDGSSLLINRATSTAADILGFSDANSSANIIGSAPARLTSDNADTFDLTDNLTLIVQADGLAEETITFSSTDIIRIPDISRVTAAQVVAVIESQANNIVANVGTGNDFVIHGGDGTAEGAGRCLVEGWEVLNTINLKYTSQPLYENDELASILGVSRLEPLTAPGARRTDTVYLDIWEREVGANEDNEHLINPLIGFETAVRVKREWVVRVIEDSTDLPVAQTGHRYFRLASIVRDTASIVDIDIRDTRIRTGLLDALDLRESELNSRIKILRTAIEHLVLRSETGMPSVGAIQLPNIVVEAYSSPGGFKQFVDRFLTNATYRPSYYFSPTDGDAQVQTKILIDSDKPISQVLITEKSRLFGPLAAATSVDISMDGGASFGLTAQSLDTEIDTRDLVPNGDRYQLKLRFNLPSVSALPADIWTTRTAMPAVRSHLAAVTGANDRLYAIGGNEAPTAPWVSSNAVTEYDPNVDVWSARTPLSQPRNLLGAAAIRSQRIYAIGGVNGTALVEEVEYYDIPGDSWTTSNTNLPTPRQQLVVASISDETIFAIAGADLSNPMGNNQSFDPFVETWTTTNALLPTPMFNIEGTVNSEDQILVFGGRKSDDSIPGSIERYNPFDDTWTTTLASMALPRAAHAGATVSNDYIYALGGYEDYSTRIPTNTNQEYDPNTNTWSARANIPGARILPAAAAVQNKVHLIGGLDSTLNTLDTNFQYQPLLTTKLRQSGFAVEYTLSE